MSKLLSVFGFIRKHKYLITIIGFVAIVGFIDDNSWVQRIKLDQQISELNAGIAKYRAEFDESNHLLNELQSNPEAIERIAREKYLMKKPNEDIYVFE